MEKVLLDTDIGTEVDDALSLAYLLVHPEIELVGITTVTGEAEKRAKLASVMCEVANQDIPILPGTERPILRSQIENFAPQSAILNQWEHKSKFSNHSAIPFMQKIIRDNPGEITLLGIAPLTNIGLLFAMDPEIPKLLKKLVLMCGSPTYSRDDVGAEEMGAMNSDDRLVLSSLGIIENNALIDPEAMELTYSANVNERISYGLNVTSQLTDNKGESIQSIFEHPLMKPVYAMAEEWFKDQETLTFHDPLAAVALVHPEICQYEKGDFLLNTKNELLSGFTYWKTNEKGKQKIAVNVDKEQFFHYFTVPFSNK
ncbi:nucleoside hydrolase [Tetragenococcus koreensis]|uniref:Nucleoside hydrolase n=1 Tax=Tetragenococcus koreensis TaxID=290335 RepID=A0AAN4ZNI6_9ENTE|nr:nucleoside hydrolase [Tetragenococcus koreensis]GEQ49653.1 nucleoside hydrolase [Tetragenococcus koreensis]GEQ52099.1 nucleoside hydrolase [Tetragenococcus koreensis]GEQ54634.1 nucleoside hydrolase [Tetragenococcus koreensis]GEQ57086.1 nucleoside hydrolase [Tetragenococcus koreensis]GEQ59666.1 nucleoside hydrolase [Tetragenococcus koreensis]